MKGGKEGELYFKTHKDGLNNVTRRKASIVLAGSTATTHTE